MSESSRALQVSDELIIDIPREFADLVVERYRGYITEPDIRHLVKWLFDNGWMDEGTARKALIRDNYFKLVRQGDTAQEAKLTCAVNYDCSYSMVKYILYNFTNIK